MNYVVKMNCKVFFCTDLMDFVHNPYRCGPLRVGMYGGADTAERSVATRLYADYPELSRKRDYSYYLFSAQT